MTADSASPGTEPELNRLEVLRGLRLSTWDAAFATVWSSLTTGAFLTGFGLWMGADNVVIGLLTAIPTLAGLVQIVSSYTGERLKKRKPYVAWYSLLGRSLWLPILLLAFLPSHSMALVLFLALFTCSFALVNIPAPAWMSWMSDLVPANHRGRYFARRNMIAGLIGMLIGLPAAWFLDFASRRHLPGVGFGVLFGDAVVGGILSFGALMRQPEPPKLQQSAKSMPGGPAGILAYYRAPFADPNFRRLMLFNMVFGAGQYFAAPFFNVYALEQLHLSYIWLQVLATITSVTSLASMPLWGWLADKFGNKPLLMIGACGVFTLPLSWVLATPGHPITTALLLVEISVIGGAFWAGVGLTQFNLLISFSPRDKTSVYVATMAAVAGLTGGLAPLIGGVVMRVFSGYAGSHPAYHLLNYHVTFCIAALLRIIGLFLLHPLVDPGARSTRDVIKQLRHANPRDWIHIRQLQRPAGEEVRLRATEALAESRTQLAMGELLTALRDPSLAVRQEAAHALGEIGDRGAVDALLAAMNDPASGLVMEAAQALARIGDRRANATLALMLNGRSDAVSHRDRMVAAQALGELGGADAVDALLTALKRPEDEEMDDVLVTALGRIGTPRATQELVSRLESSSTPRGVRIALVRALGEIGDQRAISCLREELPNADADPVMVPLLADALARLHDWKSIPSLLQRLNRLDSAVARKQVAHAIGILIGRGNCVYSLLAQEDLARDAAVSKIMQEVQRQFRGSHLSEPLRAALADYTAGDYARFLEGLKDCIEFHQPDNIARVLSDIEKEAENTAMPDYVSPHDSAPPAGLDAREHLPPSSVLCQQFLMHAAENTNSAPPVEIALLALCALRGLTDETAVEGG